MRLSLVLIAAVAVATGCASREDNYVKEMNAICRSAKKKLESLPPPVTNIGAPIDRQRVKRINARAATIGNETRAELHAVEPPEQLADEHAAFLRAVDNVATAAVRLGKVGASKRLTHALEGWRAARARADRAAARLRLHDCRAGL